MACGDPSWMCYFCKSINYTYCPSDLHSCQGFVCWCCGRPQSESMEKDMRFESWKDIWEDKKDFLNKLDEMVFEKMREYNRQEEERIKNGKEIKDYVTTADVVEKMKNLGWMMT